MISSPDAAASRSLFADWLELRALFYGSATHANIASALRLQSDDQREREREQETSEIVEEEILESELDRLVTMVSEEIGFRQGALGDAYPFEISLQPLRIAPKSEVSSLSLPQRFYVFMLLMTAGRDKLCAVPDDKQRSGRTLFHVCASYGVAGLLRGGRTYWFGHPRPEKVGFLAALSNLSNAMGWGLPKTTVPPGLPDSAQDDGIDVVGWRSYGDRRVSCLVILCQAATGNDWESKTMLAYVKSFLGWFEVPPYGDATASLAVPFPAHHEVSEPKGATFEQAAHGALHRLHGKLGVVIDRLRIVESVRDVALDEFANKNVGGVEKVAELQKWIDETVEAVARAA